MPIPYLGVVDSMLAQAWFNIPLEKWIHNEVLADAFGEEVKTAVGPRGRKHHSFLSWSVGIHNRNLSVGGFPHWLKEEGLLYLGRIFHDLAKSFAYLLSQEKIAQG